VAAGRGGLLAPSTKLRMRLRNWTFKFRPALWLMMKLTDSFATAIEMPDYQPVSGGGMRVINRHED